MTPSANQIRRQFIDFFVKKNGHKEIASASLIPENDPTVLFTTAGMHPLVPYLMGEPHPAGKRLVNVQKCVRTDDIDEVGDSTHLTFFEMMGNWSLGDYFKEGAIKMSYDLLTLPWEQGGFGLAADKLAISCFAGDGDAPKDTQSADIWKSLKIPAARIAFLPKKNNWWGPAGKTGPCGPDTEMFYWTGKEEVPEKFDPDNPKWVEIWNDVFMQYNKTAEGSFEPLKQKNVDTGLGLERLVAVMHGKDSPFETELFASAIDKIFSLSNYERNNPKAVYASRIIADHLRAAVFILGDRCGVSPCNVDQGYILRRLIRRAIRYAKMIDIEGLFTSEMAKIYIDIYGEIYPELVRNRDTIIFKLKGEEEKFGATLTKGLRELEHFVKEKYPQKTGVIKGADAFYLFETYGFPPEMTAEEGRRLGMDGVEMKEFEEAFKKHQDQSRAGAEKKFAGGLCDESKACAIHHTATHLLHAALRQILGPHVAQKGSNITKERLRFDFSHPAKMTPEEIKKVEDIVNEQIARDLPVSFEMLTVDEAKNRGAIGLFEDKYSTLGDKVKVYSVGDPSTGSGQVFSQEICGGPHVEHTGVLKHFKILKEEASSAGVRRIKAVADGVKE